jgi:hypothetical protein
MNDTLTPCSLLDSFSCAKLELKLQRVDESMESRRWQSNGAPLVTEAEKSGGGTGVPQPGSGSLEKRLILPVNPLAALRFS